MGEFLIPDGPEIPPAPLPDPMVAREEKIANDTRVEQALNSFLAAKQGTLFDAPDAFYRAQGEDAIHAAPVTSKNLDQLRANLLDGLGNDYQRQRLGTALDAQMQLTRDGMARHVAEQSLAWQRGVAQDRISLLTKEAAQHHNDTDLVDALGHAAANAARAHSRVGDGPPGGEAEDAAAAQARSGVLGAAIQARFDRGDTEGANTLLTQMQDQLDPAHAEPLQGQIDTLQRLGAAQDYADGIASATPAASPEEIDAQHEAALQQAEVDHPDDPRQQTLARHFLNQAFDARRQELQQSEGNSADAVDEWLNMPGADGGPQRNLPSPSVLSGLDDGTLDDLVNRLGPNAGPVMLLPYRPSRDDGGIKVMPLPYKPPVNGTLDGASMLQNLADVPEGENMPGQSGGGIVPVSDTTGAAPVNPQLAQAAPDEKKENANGSRFFPETGPPPGSPEYEAAMNVAVGRPVHLPDGSTIPDASSPTGKVMSPISNLGEVAAAGKKAGAEYRALLANPGTAENAIASLVTNLGLALGHGGTFDHQRGPGNSITGFEQRPQFRNISNVNVGLYGQQAGLSREELLTIAGAFARAKSSNSDSKEPYGLDPQTRQFIELGYQIGASGKFDKNPP